MISFMIVNFEPMKLIFLESVKYKMNGTYMSITTTCIYCAACLPQPTSMESYYLYKIYGTYFCIWLLILAETYTQRIQRVICAYFYPKVKQRA